MSQFVLDEIDLNLIQGIDAIDNGVYNSDNNIRIASVSSIISKMNPNWDAEENPDAAFERAVDLAKLILQLYIDFTKSKEAAKKIVSKAINEAKDSIIILEQFAPWQDYVLSDPAADNCLFVIFPSNRGGYNIQAIPDALGSFGFRKGLPESWRGLRDTELQQASGIASAIFCHAAGFIGSAETLEDAIIMAKKAITM